MSSPRRKAEHPRLAQILAPEIYDEPRAILRERYRREAYREKAKPQVGDLPGGTTRSA
jgi:hypothetical protein